MVLCDGAEMEVVNKYSYLSFIFTTTLSVKQGTNHLVAKAKKAVFNLCTCFQKCKEMTKETFSKCLIQRFSQFCCIHQKYGSCTDQTAHLMACKKYLGVAIRTPNNMVYGELGRVPLFVASYVRCVKYWFRLLQMKQTRLPNQVYRMLISLDEKEGLLSNGDTRNCLQNWLLFCVVTTECRRCQIHFVRFQSKTFRHVYPEMDC